MEDRKTQQWAGEDTEPFRNIQEYSELEAARTRSAPGRPLPVGGLLAGGRRLGGRSARGLSSTAARSHHVTVVLDHMLKQNNYSSLALAYKKYIHTHTCGINSGEFAVLMLLIIANFCRWGDYLLAKLTRFIFSNFAVSLQKLMSFEQPQKLCQFSQNFWPIYYIIALAFSPNQ